MLFPAWGDFLMKHYALAIFECFAGLISWILALFAIWLGEIGTGFGIILMAHGIDAFATLIIAFKGHHPRPARRDEIQILLVPQISERLRVDSPRAPLRSRARPRGAQFWQ